MDWLQKILANREAMRQNGVKDGTFNQLQQFADAQKAKVANSVGLLAPIEMKAKENEGLNKLGAALGGMIAKSGPVKDDLSGISVDQASGQLNFDPNSIGKLGQEALQNDENQKFLEQLQAYKSGSMVG